MKCPRCKGELDQVRRVVTEHPPHEARLVGFYCQVCRYYEPLWDEQRLEQNGIGERADGDREWFLGWRIER